MMNSRLSSSQQKTICSESGKNVALRLLYKASIHGFTGAAFHQRCDTHSPTVSVGYNSSGSVFGGFTTKPFSQSGQYVHDDQAFLFTFSGETLLKYPVTRPEYAVRMIANCGPFFGKDLGLLCGSRAETYSSPGNIYNFTAAEMHRNDLNLTECEVYEVVGRHFRLELTSIETSRECEVYKVVEKAALEKPWRTITWESEKRRELMDYITTYKPTSRSVSQARVLLVGPVGAGKSSFFNSINSVFRGHVISQAIAGCSTSSLTTKFRTYSVRAGREGEALPLVLCDTMGLEEGTGAGLDMDDITSIIKGHVPNSYQFKPSAPLRPETPGFKVSPGLKDKIHCVVYVLDTSKISIMTTELQDKLVAVRDKVYQMGIPHLVLLTKVDEACPLVMEDVRNVYMSAYIQKMMKEVSTRLGVPLIRVVPVKNYSEELELETNCDILLLSAVVQMLRSTDVFFDDRAKRKTKPKLEPNNL